MKYKLFLLNFFINNIITSDSSHQIASIIKENNINYNLLIRKIKTIINNNQLKGTSFLIKYLTKIKFIEAIYKNNQKLEKNTKYYLDKQEDQADYIILDNNNNIMLIKNNDDNEISFLCKKFNYKSQQIDLFLTSLEIDLETIEQGRFLFDYCSLPICKDSNLKIFNIINDCGFKIYFLLEESLAEKKFLFGVKIGSYKNTNELSVNKNINEPSFNMNESSIEKQIIQKFYDDYENKEDGEIIVTATTFPIILDNIKKNIQNNEEFSDCLKSKIEILNKKRSQDVNSSTDIIDEKKTIENYNNLFKTIANNSRNTNQIFEAKENLEKNNNKITIIIFLLYIIIRLLFIVIYYINCCFV